ncbi:hypothetical protein AMATHDRAFT_47174 [Amanita thiersii Skay4041]|uniref:RING-type domain-containing protein n=1 Tax=Amanita thiersii Skay4041 TaxID=703135 RepID=A0A2A9NSJ4_9AGAR|nr:hypothetical protein AMATHDRAFT_47174 [Amanita thiersii Skay4041]
MRDTRGQMVQIHSSRSSSGESELQINNIEVYLAKAKKGVKKLQGQLQSLREENETIRRELQVHKDSTERKSSTPTRRARPQDLFRIRELEAQVKKLKAHYLKGSKLQAKEVKEEAKELVDDSAAAALEDSLYRMRKLLRRFNDLMLVVTLGESESCPICLDNLELSKCSNLPCEHIISKGADETLRCPGCRQQYNRDEVETVHMNENTRWDALLDVSKAFSAFDRRGEEETEEEEGEEAFIDDGYGILPAPKRINEPCTISSSGDEDMSEGEAQQRNEADSISELSDLTNEELSASPPSSKRSFSESPTKVKRKMLAQLAEERSNKRRRT